MFAKHGLALKVLSSNWTPKTLLKLKDRNGIYNDGVSLYAPLEGHPSQQQLNR